MPLQITGNNTLSLNDCFLKDLSDEDLVETLIQMYNDLEKNLISEKVRALEEDCRNARNDLCACQRTLGDVRLKYHTLKKTFVDLNYTINELTRILEY